MVRLLIYSQDSMGLGHLRRTRNIAEQVLVRDPGSCILTLADSPVAPFFPPLPGMDYLKLPTIIKTGSDSWRTATLPLAIQDAVNLRANVILQVFHEFNPDVVLVDHMATGACGELMPLLESASRLTSRPKFFLGLRDILDSPDVIRQVWNDLGVYEQLGYYDAVLIYGCREIYDVESAYRLSPHAQQVIYCNYVGPDGHAGPPVQPSAEPSVLVMGGGGVDVFPLAQAVLKALSVLRQKMPVRALILTGPNMPSSQRDVLRAQSYSYPIVVQDRVDDAIPLLRDADAVVTMGGYNSVCEVLGNRKKALVVPRSGPSAEQRIRSQLFSQRRLVRTLDLDDLRPENLAQELGRLLTENDVPDPANIPPLDGAQRAAELLLAGLAGG